MSISMEMDGLESLKDFLADLPDAVSDAVWSEMVTSGAVIEGRAKERARHNTGKFRASIHVIHDREKFSVAVGTNDARGIWFEHGTGKYGPLGKPIVILPRNKKALSWTGTDGKKHFATKVINPGLPAQPWLYPSFEEEKPDLLKNIESAINKVLGGD